MPGKPRTAPRKVERVLELATAGMTSIKISRETGVPGSTVRGILAREGIRVPGFKVWRQVAKTDVRLAEPKVYREPEWMLEAHLAGKSLVEIARQCEVRCVGLDNWMKSP